MIRSLLLFACLFTIPLPAYGQYALRASHAGAGHGPLTGGSYALQGSVGQAAVGTGRSTPWRVQSGFWPVLLRPTPTGAMFAVAIDGTNAPVTEGEVLSVTSTVENTGDAAATQSLRLSVDGTERASESVSLDPGQSDTHTLSWDTHSGDAGDYTATVASDDATASTTVTVLAAACSPVWSLELEATDADVGSQTLTLGQSGSATAGLDPSCNEAELPPPPVGSFTDVRFVGSSLPDVDLGLGSRTDLRPDDTPTGTSTAPPPSPGEAAPAVWKIAITSEDYPISLSWDNAALGDDIPNQPIVLVDAATEGMQVSADMKQHSVVEISNSGVEALKILLDQEITRTITLRDGWNLKSIPLDAPDMSFGALLGSSCQSAFLYEPGTGYISLSASDELTPGEGGFFNCTAGSVDVSGLPSGGAEVDLMSGWNIVGPLAASVPAANVPSTPPGLLTSPFYGLDPSSGYVPAADLLATEGYWVKADADGTIDLSGGEKALEKAALAAEAQVRPPESLPDALRLTLTDARNRSVPLHLVDGESSDAPGHSTLPPHPPSDIFDVRFSSGGRTAALPVGEEQDASSPTEITLQGVAFPLRLRLDGPVQERTVRVRGANEQTVHLTADRPTAQLTRPTAQLRVGVEGRPSSVALHKSFPNPTAGRTTIRYELPAPTDVSIAVYDVLGRRVARLVEGQKPSGLHRVSFDTSTLPTGTYFYRLKAGSVLKTRRVAVVR